MAGSAVDGGISSGIVNMTESFDLGNDGLVRRRGGISGCAAGAGDALGSEAVCNKFGIGDDFVTVTG